MSALLKVRGSTVFAAFLVLLFAAAILIALTYSERARAAPLVIATPGFLLMLGWLAAEIRGGGDAKKKHKEESAEVVSAPGAVGEAALAVSKASQNTFLNELNPFLWLAGLVISLWVLGFTTGIPLFTFLYVKVRSHEGWPLSIGMTVAAWVIMYVIFEQIMHFVFYSGLIAGLFPQA